MTSAGSGINPHDITREFYFNVGGPHGFMRWGIYIFMFIAVFYLAYTIIKKVKKWRMGKPELRTDFPEKRIWAVIKYVILQAKILRERYAGLMHASMFFGFAALFVVTMIIVVQEDLTGLFFGYHFIHGNFYIIWSFFGDLFGLVVLIGLGMAIYRRYILKPTRLDTRATDTFALVLITAIILTGFFNEAMRIAITDFPSFEAMASPFGWVLAYIFNLFPKKVLEVTHYINWWVHMLCAFGFIGLIASEKLGHVLISSLNVYYMNINNLSADAKFRVPIIDPKVFEEAESFGVANVEEYTWKQLMDGDACTRCGRCQDNCPAHLTEKPLSPKKMINDVKDNMDERIPLLQVAEDRSTVESTPLIDGAVKADEFWSCTNCAGCMEACPVNIEHVPKMIDMRRYKVLMEGDMMPELQTTFMNMETNYNPYGFAFGERAAWLPADLGVKTLAEDPEVDYVYFVGCAASYDKRNQKVATAFLKVLTKAGYKVGILGPEEACCGDAAMRGGNEYLFHSLATANLSVFAAYNVKKIVCTCPHGYNMLKKEYKHFASVAKDAEGNPLQYNFEVFHHTEVIADLVKSGKIKLKEALNEKITYHDSCFLGRYNEIYDQPRDVIKAIPGTDYVEMSRNHDKSFCCGAGGARMFIEEHLGTRINQFRTKDAQASGATKICTACPFCMTMLSDGATELDIQNLQTFDLAEYVYNAMEK